VSLKTRNIKGHHNLVKESDTPK